MLPVHPSDNHGYGGLADSKLGTYVLLERPIGPKVTDLYDLRLGEFGLTVENSGAKGYAVSRPALVDAIANIIGLRSQEQMARVIAFSVVTFVANAKAIIYAAILQGIGQPMSEKVMPVNQNGPVPIAIAIVRPLQALLGVMVSYGFN